MTPKKKIEELPTCPICGAETDTVYVQKGTYDIVGCDECLQSKDAWDVLMAVIDRLD